MFRILDASVINGDERHDHAAFDGAEFAESETAFVELPAVETILGDFTDEAFDTGGCGIN